MATVIRLKRGGRRHAPYYRVVVVDSRTRAGGREVDSIGYYHPCARPQPVVEIDAQKAMLWLSRGARPSDTVRDVLSRKGLMAALASGKPLVEPVAEPVETETVAETAPEPEVEAATDVAAASDDAVAPEGAVVD